MQLNDSSGKEFDLHWHLLYESCWEGADDDFWDGAVPLTLGGVPALAPNPADMLMHIIVHGIKWNPEPPIRWIADAVSLINASVSQIDWERLVLQTRKHRVVLHIKKALNYLGDTYGAPIPPATLDAVNSIPISFIDILEHRYITKNIEINSRSFLDSYIGDFPVYLMEYRRRHQAAGYFSWIKGLIQYLLYRMHKKNTFELINYLFLRGLRITKKKLLSGLKTMNAG